MFRNPNVANFLRNWLAAERKDFHFENEIKTARLVYSVKRSRKEVVDFINSLPILLEDEASSHEARQLGNAKFKLGDHASVAEAVHLYTIAICHAPPQSQALALAHGNRGAALLKLSKFEAAYNDCQCALDLNHPKRNIILLRQAASARSMSDTTKLATCIEEMEKLKIASSSRLDEFRSGLDKMSEHSATDSPTLNSTSIVEKKQKILTSKNGGRHVIADEPIKCGDIVYTDEPYVFVPFNEDEYCPFASYRYVCDNCQEDNIIVFPCNTCQRVFYCSPRCRENHTPVHSIECNGYKINLFRQVGPFRHLAFRALLKVLATILDKISNHQRESGAKPFKNANQLWDRILDTMRDEGLIDAPTTYNSMHHPGEILNHAQMAAVLCIYLSEQTQYFEKTQNLRSVLMDSEYEWKIVMIALLLRLISQLVIFHQAFSGIFLKENFVMSPVPAGEMRTHVTKTRPFITFYPRAVLYRHSCDPNTRIAVAKGKSFAVAIQDIEAGKELFNCYKTHNCAVQSRSERTAQLKSIGLSCKCSECCRGTDEAFDRFHSVLCQRNGCGTVFVLNKDNDGHCPRCGHLFLLSFIQFYLESILSNESVERFKHAIEYYLNQCRYLPKHTLYRFKFAYAIVNKFLGCDSRSVVSSDYISRRLLDMAIEISDTTAEMKLFGSQFVNNSTPALDIIALRKVNGLEKIDTRAFVEKIKRSLMFLSPGIRRIYEKYIDEYVN